MSRIKVVLVDDEKKFRAGLRLLLGCAADIEVVGEAGNGREAVGLVSRTAPDVVLMDIRMPVMDGVTAAGLLRTSAPGLPVVMLTAFDTDEFILDALRAGAVGFLLKSTGPEALVASIRAAASGQQMLSPRVVERLVHLSRGRHDDAPQAAPGAPGRDVLEGLSEREGDVAKLVAKGLDNAQIAGELFISTATVKTHIRHILDKIGGTNRVHIAIAVLEN